MREKNALSSTLINNTEKYTYVRAYVRVKRAEKSRDERTDGSYAETRAAP